MARLTIRIDSPSLRVDRAALARFFCAIVRALETGEDTWATIVFCGERRIRSLKARHFGLDVTTDCVAFPVDTGPHGGGPRFLGEAHLCPIVMERNARGLGVTFDAEARFVFAHALLHLAGWNDRTAPARRRMFARQEQLVAAFAHRRPIFRRCASSRPSPRSGR